ncbi:MAG: hypothetical protein LBT79_01145 [Elusimicrobiota bacterium]|jgi:hypothetical protein|nr:hypothetical protein [Elusimicrobiota bacterium]
MLITAKIKGIKYKKELKKELVKVCLNELNINKSPASFLVLDKQNVIAVSKWVSPKRSRSYPYERVYDTVQISKKITVIPVIKDEGLFGDRDFLQWDTVSLMSLLDVFVIFAYYIKADKIGAKITNQEFDNSYVRAKIKEIQSFQSSALHWNLQELNKNLSSIVELSKSNYYAIEKKTKVKLHNFGGIDKFKNKMSGEVGTFMEFSRDKAQKAQNRESSTIQPKENIDIGSKAKITISNYLGGLYYFTVDEVIVNKNDIKLIECKHSKRAVLPSISDIKDGLLKMILYSNLENVYIDAKAVKSKSVLKLTSQSFNGSIDSMNSKEKILKCLKNNALSQKQLHFIDMLFKEAQQNNFIVEIRGAQ